MNDDGKMKLPIMHLEEILHCPHDGEWQVGAVFHETRLTEKVSRIVANGKFDAFHNEMPFYLLRRFLTVLMVLNKNTDDKPEASRGGR